MPMWDAIVVGAGPAGCAAAYDLAVSGRAVLLLDKSDFPRMKACAGGLTIKAVRALRYPIAPVIRETVHQVEVSKHLKGATMLRSSQPVCVMTVRAELDDYCLRRTREAGAGFERIGPISAVQESPECVTLTAGERQFQTKFIVGADGANSQVRKLVSAGEWFTRGFAIEANVRVEGEADTAFDFGVVKNGYGWVFPKGDHLNVGLYAETYREPLTRAHLAEYIRRKFATENFDSVVGQYLGTGGWRWDVRSRRVFLVGDAGGFADPLTGEGIYNAIVSGQATAKAIESELSGQAAAATVYAEQLRELRRDLHLSARLSRQFYSNLDWGFAALTLPIVRGAALKTYAQGLNMSKAWRRYGFLRPVLTAMQRAYSTAS